MAAAYASLNSVMYILQQIQHHPRPPITLEKQHMDSLCENISFLQNFLENYSHRDIGCLASQIADAAYAAEDVIESHIVDQIVSESTLGKNKCIRLFCQGVRKINQILSASTSHDESSSYAIFRQALRKVIRKWDSVLKEVMVKTRHQQPSRESSTTMLGFYKFFNEVMDRLTAQRSNPQITQILFPSTSHGESSRYTIFRQDLQKVIRKWDSAQKEVMEKIRHQRSRRETSTARLVFEVFRKVMGRHTAQRPNPQIIPLLGILSGIALISLDHIRELKLDRHQHFNYLRECIRIWESFLGDHTNEDDFGEAQDLLETQIVNAACAAEEIFPSESESKIHFLSNDHFYQDLQKVINDMNLINKEVIKIQKKWRIDDHQMPRDIISMSDNIGSSSTVPPPIRKIAHAMVGFDEVLVEIMDRLTGHQPNRHVLPIVGMGGIGKTTLARNVYDHPYIVQHFDNRVWITVSQQYGLREILVGALSCVDKNYQNHGNKSSEDELGDQLYKSLSGKRYLIILDDMWSIEAWEELKSFFPDNKNGSGIMITTRLSNVANYFGSSGLKMNFLDEDKSWELLRKIVFAQYQCCPQELEETGKKIAENCKGLPLSIVVIGGLLANSEMTREHWEYVGKNLNSMVNLEDDQHCLKILFLSYNQLPIHLKPCFLYMGVYPEDKEILVSELIKLWVDEGFLKPIKGKTLEMAAREYFNQLIDWNLILVHEWGSIGKVKVCKMHDILRDLCFREAHKDKFLWVGRLHDLDNFEGIRIQRRISIHEGNSIYDFEYKNHHTDRVLKALRSASLARSLTCDFDGYLSPLYCRLLRVFKMEEPLKPHTYFGPMAEYGNSSLAVLFMQVNARYLHLKTQRKSPFRIPSIHLQWNLQTLIVKGNFIDRKIHVPPEIWEMSQLRNLEIDEISLPDPLNFPLIHEGGDDELILRNLHTLKTARNFKLSEEVIKRIPNIKKLQVRYLWLFNLYEYKKKKNLYEYSLDNLGRLNKLESLGLIIGSEMVKKSRLIQNLSLTFPHSLNKLTLLGTSMLWEDMRAIGSLPHLQKLKLLQESFRGLKWNPVKGEFLCLKFLLIQGCDDLVHWNANRTHFPCLEQLVLSGLHNLKEIPLDIGHISTLRSIEFSYCGDSVVISAKNLFDEQVELGNEDLQVRVFSDKNSKLKRMATHNFQVNCNRFASQHIYY